MSTDNIISRNSRADKPHHKPPSKSAFCPPTGQISIEIDGRVISIAPEELLDEENHADLQKKCNDADGAAVIFLNNLLQFDGQDRFAVLDFIASLNTKPKIVVKEGAEPREDVLTAILELLPDKNDVNTFANGKLAAMEAAALFYPGALEVASAQILDTMRQRGITGVAAKDLIRDARKIAEQIEQGRARTGSNQSSQLVRAVLPEAPVPKDSVVPLGWRLALTGIASLCDGLIGNISAPVVIVGRGKDTENGAEHLRIAWYRDASWHARIVEREILASVQKILAMAAFGLPVNSNNARLVVQYLADFEAANLDCLPMANVSHRMGYQGTDGRLGFLWGTTLITADGQQDFGDRSQLDPAEWARQAVHFQGADDGDDQIAAGFHAAGDYDEWKNAIQVLISFPKAKFALYAGLAAPLLPILHAPNFIVDDANETTSGKTVNLRVVASLFGNPDEESANGKPPAMFTWKGTSVWRERAPVVVNHLPFILDDSKHAKNNEDVAETIYTIAQGRGKGRGTTKGTAAQEGFSTVMLSSGEQPATSFTEDGGTRARVITVWGSPFGARNQETGRIVRQLNDKIKCHYGHAGPRFVQYILRNRKRWPRWRKLYQRFVELWENFAGDNAVAGRLAACFAAVSVAALLAHKSVDFPWQYEDPVGPLWDELVREASDRAAAALRYTMSWAAAHEEEFFGRRKIPSPPPTQGWAGRWDENVTDKAEDCCWSWIAFNPIRLNTVLTEGGFEPGSIIRTWRDRGWLRVEVDSDGTTRTHCRMRMGRENPRFVVILREAVAAVEDEDEEVVAEESDE